MLTFDGKQMAKAYCMKSDCTESLETSCNAIVWRIVWRTVWDCNEGLQREITTRVEKSIRGYFLGTPTMQIMIRHVLNL